MGMIKDYQEQCTGGSAYHLVSEGAVIHVSTMGHFRSCSRRDQLGPFQMSDVSWLTAAPQNPLAVGQYVNNCSYEKAANVCYQEFDVPSCFPVELKQYLPNIVYSHDIQSPLRCVVLVTLRDIKQGEELFSNYYTVIN